MLDEVVFELARQTVPVVNYLPCSPKIIPFTMPSVLLPRLAAAYKHDDCPGALSGFFTPSEPLIPVFELFFVTTAVRMEDVPWPKHHCFCRTPCAALPRSHAKDYLVGFIAPSGLNTKSR